MKRSYSHLESKTYKENDYSGSLLFKSISPILWKSNALTKTFIAYLQAMYVTAVKRMKYYQTYQNPVQ